jgi:hypothetical protein
MKEEGPERQDRTMKKTIALTAATFFFLLLQVSAIPTFAAEWELWPKGRGVEPGATPKPETPETPEAAAAEKAGKEGGKATSGGISAGTIGWTVGIIAGVAAIAIAAGSGGGGNGSSTAVQH